MDIQLYALFISAGFLATAVAFAFKSKGIGGIAAIVFILTGLALLNTGISTNPVFTTINNVSSFDAYGYAFNATYNTSVVNNVTTSLNKTFYQTYALDNQWSDYTNLFAVMLIAIGAIVGFEAMWRS